MSPKIVVKQKLKVNRKYFSGRCFTVTRRQAILIRDNFICAYCPKLIEDTTYEIDHIKSRKKQGKTNYKNLILSCRACNNKKYNRDVYLFCGRRFEGTKYHVNEAIEQLLINQEIRMKFLKIYPLYENAIEDLRKTMGIKDSIINA